MHSKHVKVQFHCDVTVAGSWLEFKMFMVKTGTSTAFCLLSVLCFPDNCLNPPRESAKEWYCTVLPSNVDLLSDILHVRMCSMYTCVWLWYL